MNNWKTHPAMTHYMKNAQTKHKLGSRKSVKGAGVKGMILRCSELSIQIVFSLSTQSLSDLCLCLLLVERSMIKSEQKVNLALWITYFGGSAIEDKKYLYYQPKLQQCLKTGSSTMSWNFGGNIEEWCHSIANMTYTHYCTESSSGWCDESEREQYIEGQTIPKWCLIFLQTWYLVCGSNSYSVFGKS